MHKVSHPKDDVYVSSENGGRGLTCIVESVDASIQPLKDYREKHLNGRFKRPINDTSYEKTWICLRKGNFKSETESLLIASENNTIRTNHINARIEKTQQNSKCRLRGD